MHRKNLSLLSLFLIIALLASACVQPVPMTSPTEGGDEAEAETDSATSTDAPVGDIQPGGVWVEASSADGTILNPILYSDGASGDILQYLYPGLLGTNPQSGAVEPTGMAESWDVSEDGLVWTFQLRDGVVWSDGNAVDAEDFKFTYDAIASDLVETPRKANIQGIERIETPDPLTIVVTFDEVKCDGLLDLGLGWLPSHLYSDDFSDIMENEMNEAPTVSAGEFIFQSWARDDNSVLLRNDTYWEGAPYMDGRIYKIVPDAGSRLAQLQSGEVTEIGVEPNQLGALQNDPNVDIYNFKSNGYAYIGLNLADNENPQPGQDEDGNLIEQDPHRILSDLSVRQAIAHSLDYQSIIDNVYLGQGYQIAANVLPAIEWAYNDELSPYETDLELAAQILEDAGWVDEDGDGIREKDGETLSLNLVTNAGNTTREDLGVLVQDQLGQVGFDINFEAIEFGTLVEQLLGQTFDMIIISWGGLSTDPHDDSFWHSQYDTPGSGFNFISYNNPKIDELLEAGNSIPGCAPEDRADIYKEIQQIIHDDIPYVFVTGSVGNIGYSADWDGHNPGPWSFIHNIREWYQKSLQP